MMRFPILFRCLVLGAFVLTGCAGQTPPTPTRRADAFAVKFSVTRTADHAELASVSLPVNVGGEAKTKLNVKAPAENQPVVPGVLARLQRTRQPGVYELVTQVSVREAIRNKKGKLKVNKRFIGALVPTRPGEIQIVSAEGDPIHVEARLEHR